MSQSVLLELSHSRLQLCLNLQPWAHLCRLQQQQHPNRRAQPHPQHRGRLQLQRGRVQRGAGVAVVPLAAAWVAASALVAAAVLFVAAAEAVAAVAAVTVVRQLSHLQLPSHPVPGLLVLPCQSSRLGDTTRSCSPRTCKPLRLCGPQARAPAAMARTTLEYLRPQEQVGRAARLPVVRVGAGVATTAAVLLRRRVLMSGLQVRWRH